MRNHEIRATLSWKASARSQYVHTSSEYSGSGYARYMVRACCNIWRATNAAYLLTLAEEHMRWQRELAGQRYATQNTDELPRHVGEPYAPFTWWSWLDELALRELVERSSSARQAPTSARRASSSSQLHRVNGALATQHVRYETTETDSNAEIRRIAGSNR